MFCQGFHEEVKNEWREGGTPVLCHQKFLRAEKAYWNPLKVIPKDPVECLLCNQRQKQRRHLGNPSMVDCIDHSPGGIGCLAVFCKALSIAPVCGERSLKITIG